MRITGVRRFRTELSLGTVMPLRLASLSKGDFDARHLVLYRLDDELFLATPMLCLFGLSSYDAGYSTGGD